MSEQTGVGALGRTGAPTMADAAEMLWVVLANVGGGDWTQQSAEWQEAAARWRDNYFAAVTAERLRVVAPQQEPARSRPFNWPPDKGSAPSQWCAGDDKESHGWCMNRNASECHCTCNCHKRAAAVDPPPDKEPR
jgi:hypothetical protein